MTWAKAGDDADKRNEPLNVASIEESVGKISMLTRTFARNGQLILLRALLRIVLFWAYCFFGTAGTV